MSVEKSEPSWRDRRKPARRAVSADEAPTERKSWRKKGAPPPVTGAHARRGIDPTDPRRAVYRQRIMIGLLAMAFTSAFVAFIIYLYFRPRQAPLVPLYVTYPASLQVPPNAYAAEDYERLRATFVPRDVDGVPTQRDGNANVGVWRQPANDSGITRSSFLSTLLRPLEQKGFRPGGPRKDVIMFYISAHGAVDENGRPCLLLQDSSPVDSETWLPFESVLDALNQHPKYGQASGTKKIVLLDANRLLVHERAGVLHNGFAAALGELIHDKGYSDIFVVNSTSPGEIGWSSPMLAGSIFGFFVAEGLNGQADIIKRDRRITLEELELYLRRAVSSWAQSRRSAAQHPRVYAAVEKTSFPIAHATSKNSLAKRLVAQIEPEKLRQSFRQRAAPLEGLTARYQRLREAAAFVRAPFEWAQLETDLTRLDQLLFAGDAYDADYTQTIERVRGVLTELENLPELQGLSLAYQRRIRTDFDQQVDEWIKSWQKPNFDEWKEPLEHPAAVNLAFRWVVSGNDASRLDAAVNLIDRFPAAQPPEILEARLMRILAQHADLQSSNSQILDVLATRQVAERAALPRDLRSVYWITNAVDGADAKRREAEDLLMFASPSTMVDVTRGLAEARDAYEQAEKLADQISQAYRLRDEAFALVPPLAHWAAHQTQFRERDPGLFPKINQLVDDLTTLVKALEPEPNRELSGKVPEVENAVKALRASLAAVQKDYFDICDPLLRRRAGDQQLIRQLLEALSVPTLDPRIDRALLRNRLVELMFADKAEVEEAELKAQDGKKAESKSAGEGPEGQDRLLHALAALDRHPLVKLTDRRGLALPAEFSYRETPLEAPAPGGSNDQQLAARTTYLAQQGGLLRRRLASLDDDRERLTNLSSEALRRNAAEPGEMLRAGVSGADRVLRASAGLANKPLWHKNRDPGFMLRMIDQRWFYLWQAQRALDDFWGPVTPEGAYFAQAANRYLNHAQDAGRQVDAIGCWFGKHDLLDLARRREEAAQFGILLNPQSIMLHPGETIAPNEVQITAAPNMPRGQAALLRQKPWENRPAVPALTQGDREEEYRTSLAISESGIEPPVLEQRFRYTDLEGTARLELTALYRGHTWTNPMYIRTPGEGHEVLVQRINPEAPTVRVEGEDPRPMAIMFVFDCSATMEQLVDVEGGKRRRFDEARDALLTVLRSLPEANYKIGLALYGHRVGVREGGRADTRPAPLPELAAPQGLPVGSDVQVVMPLTDWEGGKNPQALSRIQTLLNNVRPFGKTPLYFSIRKCISDELDQLDPRVYAQHVIVITDGENEQNPTESRPEDFTTLADVQGFLNRKKNVQLEILGFDLGNTKTLRDLAQSTGGKYISVKKRDELVQSIRDMVKLGEFTVTAAGEARVRPLALGQRWSPSDWSGGQANYEIRVQGVEPDVRPLAIRLEGGEALELQVRQSQLLFRPYTPADESTPRGRTPGGDFDVITRIGARVGRGEDGRVQFPIAIQRHNSAEFTPRPKHVWVEIKPMGERNDASKDWPTFVFYDLQFENRRPVPEMVFTATQWPEVAELAEVRFWFRMDDDVIPNDQFPVPRGSDPVTFTSKEVPGVRFEVEVVRSDDNDNQRVRVREIHDGSVGAVDLNRLRVRLLPPPDEIKHQYISDSQRVLHEFTYAGGRQPQTLEITERERITAAGAQTLEAPQRVRIEKR